jgi:hypothetical protein
MSVPELVPEEQKKLESQPHNNQSLADERSAPVSTIENYVTQADL